MKTTHTQIKENEAPVAVGDITQYLNKTPSGSQGGRTQACVGLIDNFFANMKSGDTVTNGALVGYLSDKGVVFTEKEIKTDVPLAAAPKTAALSSGVVTKAKADKVWVYTRV